MSIRTEFHKNLCVCVCVCVCVCFFFIWPDFDPISYGITTEINIYLVQILFLSNTFRNNNINEINCGVTHIPGSGCHP